MKNVTLRDAVSILFTTWIMWASYEIVELKSLSQLNEYKIDSINPILQANSEK